MLSTASALANRLTAPLWRPVLVGILLGALAGGFGFQSNRDAEVTALIRLYQPLDPDQIITNSAPTAETQQSYISGEIAYLNSQGFADAVAKQLGESEPAGITAVQDSQSSVISMSAMEPDFAAAQQVVTAGVDVYHNHLQQQGRDRSQAAIQAIDETIGQLHAGATPNSATDDSKSSWSQVDENSSTDPDVAERIQQLDIQRLALDVQSRRSAPLQVVQPPTLTKDDGMPSWALGAAGGGLLGGLIAVVGASAWHRRAGVITEPAMLQAYFELVLLPAVRVDRLNESSHPYTQLARSLYAQLPSPGSACIVLMGASGESGTAEIAKLVAAAVAEHRPARVVHLADGSAAMHAVRSPDGTGAEAATIIDGGSVDASPAVPDAARMADQIIVVARLGRDNLESVRIAEQLARRNGVPVSAICTRGRSTQTVVTAVARGRHHHGLTTPTA